MSDKPSSFTKEELKAMDEKIIKAVEELGGKLRTKDENND